jgi:hypothetical protein
MRMLCCREAEKECDLLEKKLQRLEAARAAEVAALTADLGASRDEAAAALRAKDAKVTDLIEELGNTQALLSEKEAALAEVRAAGGRSLLLPLVSRPPFHWYHHHLTCLLSSPCPTTPHLMPHANLLI